MSTLETNLSQFTGSTIFYKYQLFPKYCYTEGVQYLAKHGECYWLLDFIFSHQYDDIIQSQPFQVWIITVQEDKSATIRLEDGNKNTIKTFELSFTDFPLQSFTLWLTNNTLLLPNEY